MELQSTIESIAEQHLANDKHFLVDVSVSAKKGPTKVLILLDGDEGISIDDCVALSRKVSLSIEEQDLITSAFTLDVSSPGLDHPLKLIRQYEKNIGRTVRVMTLDGEEVEGELNTVSKDTITVMKKKKKGKKAMEDPQVIIAFEEIKKTNVLVSFK